MEYILTQEDIDRYGFTDAIEGDKATPAELSTMGMYTAPFTPQEERAGQLSVPTPILEAQKLRATPNVDMYTSDYAALRSLGLDVGQTNEALAAMGAADAPAVTVDQSDTSQFQPAFSQMTATDTTTTTMPSADMLGLLSTPISQDPFENLSRSQRTMLGFAALKDAGMALQGKEGGAVSSLLGDFRARADMERKRQAAVARQEALKRLTGGFDGGNMNRQAIINAMATGLIDGPTGTAMLAELERKSGVSQEIAGKEMMIGQIDALLFDPALGKALGIEGFLRTPFAELGLDTETARVKARIDQIKGGAFLQAFESLKGGGQITELEGQKAEAAQSRLNTAQSEEDFKNALMEYKFYIQQGIRRLNGEQIPPDTLYDQAASDPLNIR